ncbi:MAG: fluoride efflux transporter CrcB [Devosiaceae bacterium]|nr:fluoride efflux transporter CrcB [Devosiaceae bacterium]
MNGFLLVGAGGALGAMGRYGVGILVAKTGFGGFPLATIAINIIGSVLMGLFIGILAKTLPPWQGEARLFIAIGLLGGFTTFSAFSLDTIVLFERGALMQAGFYVLITVTGSILALWAGLLIARGLPL